MPGKVGPNNSSQEFLNQVVDTINNVGDNIVPPADPDNPEQHKEDMAKFKAIMQNGSQVFDEVANVNEDMVDIKDNMKNVAASSKHYFKLSQMLDEGDDFIEDDPSSDMSNDLSSQLMNIQDHAELHMFMKDYFSNLDQQSFLDFREALMSIIRDSNVDGVSSENSAVESLQEYVRVISDPGQPQEKAAQLSQQIFQLMPQSDQGETVVKGVEKVVAESNFHIKKLAQEFAAKQIKKEASEKPFNLKKEAQHKALDNVVMHMPNGNRIDAFTGQLISDWHIYERNKGWGLKVDDAVTIDYEALWRNHIMDKYSRPYRDSDGNWVGGYIEKRFETDKWIPETNNYQLKPGQKRRPYLPEYRSTEARMQDMRSKTTEEDDREFIDTSKPFDWKKASSKGSYFSLDKVSNSRNRMNKKAIFDFLSKKREPKNQAPQNNGVHHQIDLANVGEMASETSHDFNVDDRVYVPSTGDSGVVMNTEGPMVRVRIKGVPGGATFYPKELKKQETVTAQAGPGRPASDPFALEPLGLRAPGQTNEEAQKANSLAQKKICPFCGATNNPNALQCVACNGNISHVKPSAMPRTPHQTGQSDNSFGGPQPNSLINQIGKAAQVMPTNNNMSKRDIPESMMRRRKTTNPVDELSDEIVNPNEVSIEHLDNVKQDAENLGL